MGLMRFRVHDPSRIDRQALDRTCLVGQEDLPYVGRAYISGDELVIERREDASASLWAPWKLEGYGQWTLSTTSLMERPRPYLLEVELARGMVFRIRNQMALWEQLGLKTPPELEELVAKATRSFSRAATQQDDHARAADTADEALVHTASANVMLAGVYADQAIRVRATATPRLPTLVGVRLGQSTPKGADAERLKSACSMVTIPAAWKSIEASEGKRRWKATDDQITWAHEEGLRAACGPLLDLDEHGIPEWAYLWEGDFEAVASLMLAHVKAVVTRYKGRVQLWNVAARVNRPGALSLSDEQRLQLAARAIRVAREIDPKTPVVVGFDQPWGEYMSGQTSDLGPIDFADALERADLGVSGFGVELNVGYAPHGSTARSPLDLSRLLDQWSLRLELPLMIGVTAPSSSRPDPLADPRAEVVAGGSEPIAPPSSGSNEETHVLIDPPRTGDSASDTQPFQAPPVHEARQTPIDKQFQTRWAEQHLPILIAKNCVQVVMWNQYRDDEPHQFPNGGCVDNAGKPKPVLDLIERLRKKYLV